MAGGPSRNWILSKLTLLLTVIVAVVIFARILSYILVETISLQTFDNIAVSVLKTFLNESQFNTVVDNVKASSRSKTRDVRASEAMPVKSSLSESVQPSSDGESECAVCKYVMPPLVRCEFSQYGRLPSSSTELCLCIFQNIHRSAGCFNSCFWGLCVV